MRKTPIYFMIAASLILHACIASPPHGTGTPPVGQTATRRAPSTAVFVPEPHSPTAESVTHVDIPGGGTTD